MYNSEAQGKHKRAFKFRIEILKKLNCSLLLNTKHSCRIFGGISVGLEIVGII